MTSALIRFVLAVVVQIANEFTSDTIAIGAGEFCIGITRFGSLGTKGDIILIRTVFTIVLPIANLPAEDTASIIALESITTGTFVTTFFRFFVGSVPTIVDPVALIFGVDADVIIALEPFSRTEFAAGKSGRAIGLVGGVKMAIAFTVASEMFRDAMAAVTLESAVLTGESFASDLIRAVVTVAVVVAAVASGNTFTI